MSVPVPHLTDGLGGVPGGENVGEEVAAVPVLPPASRAVKHRVVAADELLLRPAVRVVPEPGAGPGGPEVLGQAVLGSVGVVGLAGGPVSGLQASLAQLSVTDKVLSLLTICR